jgi:protein-tyrosine phosphatase
MAQFLLLRKIKDKGLSGRLHVLSAGLCARAGDEMAAAARVSMRKRGIEPGGFFARAVDAETVGRADVIITMTLAQLGALTASFPAARGKAFLLGDFCGGGDVPDPFGGGGEEYEACAARLEDMLGQAMEKITVMLGDEK